MAKKVVKSKNTEPLVPLHLIRGRVVSVKTAMTVTVLVERRVMHPLYKKTYRRSRKYLVHDEQGVKLGDIVDIVKIKPISKNKHFKILNVVGQNLEAIVTEQLKAEAAKAIAEVMPEQPEAAESSDKPLESSDLKTSDSKKGKEKKLNSK
ncbi:MAG: 30S ribosomal protein S17 [Candidatus Daviesbacteria bacterium]|nr:30S ribosomal protein S17 [Candidatus Daviesbacteria bacterium]